MGDKGYFAPWTQTNYPRRVLDIGTGTGEWCFDFAEEFPQTELIIGTDLSKIQPEETPPNVGSSSSHFYKLPARVLLITKRATLLSCSTEAAPLALDTYTVNVQLMRIFADPTDLFQQSSLSTIRGKNG